METLQNEFLTVEVSDLGAELQSIKDADEHEYLWQGDDKYWGRRSPILFPIVSGLYQERIARRAAHSSWADTASPAT